MLRSAITPFLFLCFMLAALAAQADACSCVTMMEGTHPCQLYQHASAVFVGQVSDIGPMTPVSTDQPGIYTMRDVVVRLTIDEGFRGVTGQTVAIYLTGTSCDFNFQKGERYFVYAMRDAQTQKLHVDSCSGTQPLNLAARDLAYARGVVRGEKSPDIFGSVVRAVRQDATDYVRTIGVAGIKVILESDGHSVAVFTDADGRFEVADLPPGRYRAHAEIPDNLRLTYHTEGELTVGEGRCSGVGFVVTSLSTINGRLVDAEGKPAGDVTINLIPVNANNQVLVSNAEYDVATEKDGRYHFDSLSAGRYLVAINPQGQPKSYARPYRRTYYPDVTDAAQATVIALVEGQEVKLNDFHVPPQLVAASIAGIVQWPDGSPARGAIVYLEFTEQQWREGYKQVDDQGRFSFQAYEGFKYIVHAEFRQNGSGLHAEPVSVTVGKKPAPVTLIINQQGYNKASTPKKTP